MARLSILGGLSFIQRSWLRLHGPRRQKSQILSQHTLHFWVAQQWELLTGLWGLPGPERTQKKVRGSLVKVENLETPTLGTSGEVILSFLPTTLNCCSSGLSEVYRALRCYPKSPLCVIYTEKGQIPKGSTGFGKWSHSLCWPTTENPTWPTYVVIFKGTRDPFMILKVVTTSVVFSNTNRYVI